LSNKECHRRTGGATDETAGMRRRLVCHPKGDAFAGTRLHQMVTAMVRQSYQMVTAMVRLSYQQ
jgi:hypothetical protein